MALLPLHEVHAALGGRFGDVNGREVVLSYADGSGSAPEYETARTSAGVADLSAREWVRITGPDRVSYLQGMVTNDVSGLATGQTTYAALLTAKGAMVSDARIWRREEELLLDVEPGHGAKVREALAKYLISEDAELIDASEQLALFVVAGPKAPDVLLSIGIKPPAAGQFVEVGGWLVTPSASYDVPAFELVATAQNAQALHAKLLETARPLGWEALEVLRVESGTPRYALDMDDKTIPLEANLERALHYKKGCYIGQEVIARATFRGHVNRKLVGLTLPADAATLPAPKTELRIGERKVGWITSVVRSPSRGPIALGYVHRDLVAPGTMLNIADSPLQAAVSSLPFR